MSWFVVNSFFGSFSPVSVRFSSVHRYEWCCRVARPSSECSNCPTASRVTNSETEDLGNTKPEPEYVTFGSSFPSFAERVKRSELAMANIAFMARAAIKRFARISSAHSHSYSKWAPCISFHPVRVPVPVPVAGLPIKAQALIFLHKQIININFTT